MAEALGLDPSYLSQLENGRREVDDWYLVKAEKLASDFEKSKEVKIDALKEEAPPPAENLRLRCHLYLDLILDECRGDREQLAWTLVELKKRFPIAVPPPPNSGLTYGEAMAAVNEAERRYSVGRVPQESQPSQSTDAPTSQTDVPSPDTSRTSKEPPPSVLKKVPK